MGMKKQKWQSWPVGIVVAMATFIGGIVIGVSIMLRNTVPLVADDYYAQEIAYQAHLDKEKRMLATDKKPELDYQKDKARLALKFPHQPTQGKLTFFRPSDPQQDFKIGLETDENGNQLVDLRHAASGLWIVQIDWSLGGEGYYYEQKITF